MKELLQGAIILLGVTVCLTNTVFGQSIPDRVKELEKKVSDLESRPEPPAYAELEQLRKNLESLKERISTMSQDLGVPTHAVMFFDSSKGCPNGWTDLGQKPAFAGRVIITVGSGGKDAKKRDLSYVYRASGGEIAVKLTKEQMPRHQHVIKVREERDNIKGSYIYDRTIGTGDTKRESEYEGADKPHENMMPYIALHLCRKN